MKRLFLLLAAAAVFAACSPDAEGINETPPPQEEPEEKPEEPGDEPENPNDPGEDPGEDPDNPDDPGEDPGNEPVDPETAAARVAALCDRINENLVIQHTLYTAASFPDCITKVVPVAPNGQTVGYAFAFKQNKPVTLYPDPVYEWPELVPRFEGHPGPDYPYDFCWILNDDWLYTADGTTPVFIVNESGTVPRLKVEQGYWHITCDDGTSWWPLGPAPDGQTELPAPPACRWIEERTDYWQFGIRNYSIVIPKEGTLHVEVDTHEELIFTPGQTHTVYLDITGGSSNTVVTAELENPDGSYTIRAHSDRVFITANVPTANKVIITVKDGSRIATATVAVTLKPVFSDKVISVVTPGTLAALLEELSADYDLQSTTELTIIGTLNEEDFQALRNSLPNLAVLDLENVNLEILPEAAFVKNTSLISIKLPKTLQTIGEEAFSGCSSLVDITIPESVTEIGYNAFYGCSSLVDITIPESVTEIRNGAFWDCSSLASITIPESVTEIGNYVFWYCSSLTSVTILGNVTSIRGQTFEECTSLTTVILPASITSIGNRAFNNCSNLTDFAIPENVTKIGRSAFYRCPGPASLTIPASVTEIGESAFYSYPSNLEKVYCKAAVPPTCVKSSSSSWLIVFANTSTATLYVPVGTAEAYKAADGWKEFRNIVEMEF